MVFKDCNILEILAEADPLVVDFIVAGFR